MTCGKVTCLILLCCGILLALGLSTEPALAADRGTTADKDIATKEGVSGSLGSKKIDSEKLPGKLEIGFAIGSIITMIAAIKYL